MQSSGSSCAKLGWWNVATEHSLGGQGTLHLPLSQAQLFD
jgi:hypothetical protein